MKKNKLALMGLLICAAGNIAAMGSAMASRVISAYQESKSSASRDSNQEEHNSLVNDFTIRSLLACVSSNNEGKESKAYCSMLIKDVKTPEDDVQRKIYSQLPPQVRDAHLRALEKDITARAICIRAQQLGERNQLDSQEVKNNTTSILKDMYAQK